jgi:hypothetical protein
MSLAEAGQIDGILKFVASTAQVTVADPEEEVIHGDLRVRLGTHGGAQPSWAQLACGYLTPEGDVLHLEVGSLPDGMTEASLIDMIEAELPGWKVVSAHSRFHFG